VTERWVPEIMSEACNLNEISEVVLLLNYLLPP
jgi:hypothetical protein